MGRKNDALVRVPIMGGASGRAPKTKRQQQCTAPLISCTATGKIPPARQAGYVGAQAACNRIRIGHQNTQKNARAWEDAPRCTPPPSAGTCPGGSGCRKASRRSSFRAPCVHTDRQTVSHPAVTENRRMRTNEDRT